MVDFELPNPNRFCRFRFSLRTLLVLVTVIAAICGYVAWQAKIVQRRAAMLGRIGDEQGLAFSPPGTYIGFFGYPNSSLSAEADPSFPSVSWLRQFLGDESIQLIWIADDTRNEEVDEIREVFPEAQVLRLKPEPIEFIYPAPMRKGESAPPK